MLHACRPGSTAARSGSRRCPGGPLAVLGLTCFGAVAAAGPAVGQDAAPPSALHEVEQVRLVMLPATVADRDGRPVPGLGPHDFELIDGGEPRAIDLFATERNAPISIAFLLDVSGSMKLGDRLGQARGAIRFFAGALGPDDRAGLICFADGAVDWVVPFTGDRAGFERVLADQVARGRTALYDALAASPDLVARELRGRKAIVLITDGLDNASEASTLRAVWLARRVNVPIYTLSFIPMRASLLPRRALDALAILERFSAETGGALYAIHRPRDLARAVEAIQAELRRQYVIGFYSQDAGADGSFRPVQLRARDPRLTVRTRSGYYPEP